MNFDNAIPEDIRNQLSDDQLIALMDNIKASAAKAVRGNTADTHTFGESVHTVVTGAKGNCLMVTRTPKTGRRAKGTYLATLYRSSQILELAEANPECDYFAWLKGFVEIEIDSGRLEHL